LMKVPSINQMQPWNCGSCHQNSSLLNGGPTNLVGHGIIDARCNKYVIVVYCPLAPIPHDNIILSHMIMFHEQDEIQQMLFQGQLGWSPNGAMWLPCGPCMTNNGWDHKLCANFSNSPKVKLVRDLDKLGVACMVVRMSCFEVD
jgi:hypothetical protein